jgi:two-component system response regulator AtoC
VIGPRRILVVDDEPSSLELLEVYLKDKGYQVACAMTGQECLVKTSAFAPHVIVLDIRLPDADGLQILERLNRSKNAPPVIIVTAFHDMATTIKAMKLGAFEYIPKPIDVDELEAAIKRSLEPLRHRQGKNGLVIHTSLPFERGELIGKAKAIKEIFKTVGVLSGNRINVLIEGETGTGKELVARAIHYHSPCKDQPFIAINCSAIVDNLLESELFGHERGAFTGAVATRKGKVELAGNGTILLDEVGEIPFELQAKLLRFLQEKEFQRVGGETTLKAGARVIAATNRNIASMVREGKFREDLYYRLSVATIKIPPLRDRRNDIPPIVEHLLRKINQDLHMRLKGVEEQALRMMVEYEWPGNVRELENVLTSAALNTQGEVVRVQTVAPLLKRQTDPAGRYENRDMSSRAGKPEMEKDRIVRVLNEAQWHYGNACKELGISRPTLNKKLKQYGIAPKRRNSSLSS